MWVYAWGLRVLGISLVCTVKEEGWGMGIISGSAGEVQAIDRLRETIETSNQKITQLNKLLLAVTVVIGVLTLVQVLVALNVITRP